jgi:hypothetical protein
MFWRIWARHRRPSSRPPQNHACIITVTLDGDDVESFTMAHVRHVERGHRVVRQDCDLKPVHAVCECAPREQSGQRTLQSAQIDGFHD